MKIYKIFLYIILIGEKTFRYHFRIHGRVPCTVTSVEVHVISVYFILEHVLYFQTTCFPYACLTPIHDHSWTIQSIKIFIACSIICSISFFREHFSGGKFSIFQIFGNFFEQWRKYVKYQNECKIEYFRAKYYIFAQLKVAILTYHIEKLVRVQAALKLLRTRVSADDTRQQGIRGQNLLKSFSYDFNTVWLFTALCRALPLITSKR